MQPTFITFSPLTTDYFPLRAKSTSRPNLFSALKRSALRVSIRGPHRTQVFGQVLHLLDKELPYFHVTDLGCNRVGSLRVEEGDPEFMAIEMLGEEEIGKGDVKSVVKGIERKFGGKVDIDVGDDVGWIGVEGGLEVCVTLIGGRVGSEEVACVVSGIAEAGGRVEGVRSLGKKGGFGGCRALELRVWVDGGGGVEMLKRGMADVQKRLGIDICVQRESVFRRGKRLALFDLDSTLIAQETIDEIAAEAGVEDEVSSITERAMNGEIDFKMALRERVALVAGLPVARLDAIKERVRYTPGAKELIQALSSLGCTTAVVSGGFAFLANHVRDELGIDHAFSNKLEIGADGRLTGNLEYPVVDADFKASVVTMLSRTKGLHKEQVLAVGDGSNDLKMMAAAGLGVAFNAKPKVQRLADSRINQRSLTSVLYLLGLTNSDIEALLNRPR